MSEENQQMKTARESAEKRSNSTVEAIEGWPHYNGVPMVKISCAAAELIPTRQYANVTVGPVQVTCFATADGELLFEPDGLTKALTKVLSLCEAACAEERQTVHAFAQASAVA